MEYLTASDIFFLVASIGFVATTILGAVILAYIILLVRGLKRVVDALETGVDLMKRDVESIHKHLAEHSGILSKVLSTLIDVGIDRFGSRKKKAKKASKKRVAKKKTAKKKSS